MQDSGLMLSSWLGAHRVTVLCSKIHAYNISPHSCPARHHVPHILKTDIPLVNIKTYYFHINMCYVLMMLLRNFILLVVMVRTTTEMISDGAVLLKPCGVLEMEVSWVDSPKDGS